MPPVKHALLSASSASRWLVCTAAPRFEEGLPETASEYAKEGSLAHAIAELKVRKKFTEPQDCGSGGWEFPYRNKKQAAAERVKTTTAKLAHRSRTIASRRMCRRLERRRRGARSGSPGFKRRRAGSSRPGPARTGPRTWGDHPPDTAESFRR